MIVVNENDQELKLVGFDLGGGEIYHYYGIPFSGVLQRYDQAILKWEVQCVNGYPEGFEREYYPNGQLWEESYIKYNLPYGIMKTWDESGNLIDEYDWGPEPNQ